MIPGLVGGQELIARRLEVDLGLMLQRNNLKINQEIIFHDIITSVSEDNLTRPGDVAVDLCTITPSSPSNLCCQFKSTALK